MEESLREIVRRTARRVRERADLSERNQAIRAMRSDGYAPSTIAQDSGLSTDQIARICRKRT